MNFFKVFVSLLALQCVHSAFQRISPPNDYFNPNVFDLNDQITAQLYSLFVRQLDYFCPSCEHLSEEQRLFRYRFSDTSLADLSRSSRIYYFDSRCISIVRDSLLGSHVCRTSSVCPKLHPHLLETHWYGDVRLCLPYHDVEDDNLFDVFEILVGRPKSGSFETNVPNRRRGTLSYYNTFTSLPPNNLNRTFYEYCKSNTCHLITSFCHMHRTPSNELPADFSFSFKGDYLEFTHYPETRTHCASSTPYQKYDYYVRDRLLPLNYQVWPFRSRESEFASPVLFKSYDTSNLSFTPYRLDYNYVSTCSYSQWSHYPHLCKIELQPISKVVDRVHVPSVSSTYSMSNVVDDLLGGLENLLSTYFDKMSTLLIQLLDKIVDVFTPLFKKFLAFILDLFYRIVDFVLSLIPYSDEFYTALFLALLLRFYFDTVQCLVILIVTYFALVAYHR